MVQYVGKSSLEQHFHKSAIITFEISGALHLAQPGLVLPDWLAGKQNTGYFRNFQNWL